MENESNFIKPPEQGEKKYYKARVVCSGCKKEMGEKEGFEEEGLISHSVCPECVAKMRAEMRKFKEDNPEE